jgi:hypothetical protein
LAQRWHRLGWDVTGKAGIFGNDVGQRQFVVEFDSNDIPLVLAGPTHRDGSRVSFVGELGLSLTYKVSDRLSLRGGYNVMWIEGIALAADQLDFDVLAGTWGTALRDSGGVFLHGASVGLEARF